MKQYLILIITIFSLAACKQKPKGARKNKNNEITKIEIATGGCFGPCQFTVVSIDSSLTYKYWGEDYSFVVSPDYGKKDHLVGYYSAKISQPFWDTINMKLEHVNYKMLDTTYRRSVDDQSLDVFIHYQNKVKHIRAQSASLPDGVGDVFYYIVRSYKTVKPKATKDTFKFEKLPQRVRIPDVTGVKFSPPTKNK